MLWSAFIGGSYTAHSASMAVDQSVNLFTETRQVPGSPKQSWMFGTPGQKYSATVATLEGRGWFSQDGRTFVVEGMTLYEQTNGTTYTALGTIPYDGKMCFFASNGKAGEELGITGGGQLNVLNLQTNTLTTIALPFVGPVMIVFQDGYALINQANSPIVWFSALEDMTTWDALDFFARSGTSDNCVGLGVSEDRVGFLGSKTTTSFYDSGDADTPFVPYQGTTIQNGLVSPYLVSGYRDTFVWVSSASKGAYRVVSGTFSTAQPISTHQIESWLARCSTLDDAWMTTYEQDGHVFFCITAPSSPDEIKTYCYDATEKDYPWHARGNWDAVNGVYTLWRVKGAAVVNGTVYASDYQTGDIYTLDLDTYADNGQIQRAERRAPYLGAENQWAFVDQFELGTDVGIGLPSGQGVDPVATLYVSYDMGKTFQEAGDSTLGAQGDTEARTTWTQLGRGRLDRIVFKVAITDPVKRVLGPGAWLRLGESTWQL